VRFELLERHPLNSPQTPVPLSSPSRRPRFGGARLWIGLGVTGIWLFSMALVWRDETGRSGAGLRGLGVSPEIVMSTWIDLDQWVFIEQNGRKLGSSRLEIRKHSEVEEGSRPVGGAPPMPGFALESRTRLGLPFMGVNVPIDLRMKVEMDSSFEMRTLQAVVRLAGQPFDLQAFVEDRTVFFRIRSGRHAYDAGGGVEDVAGSGAAAAGSMPGQAGFLLPDRDLCGSRPLVGPIVLGDVLLPVLSRGEQMAAGAEWKTRVANPLFGQFDQTVHVKVEGEEKIRVGERDRETWRLTERVGTMASTVWYDRSGRLVRRQLPSGLTMTLVESNEVLGQDAEFRRILPLDPEIDRAWIREHQDPALAGVSLEELLPSSALLQTLPSF
jgi:hypothetical protein